MVGWVTGALPAYAGGAFTTEPESAPKQDADYVVNAVPAAAAIALLVVAVRRSSVVRGSHPSSVNVNTGGDSAGPQAPVV